jgi:hypothetical protein
MGIEFVQVEAKDQTVLEEWLAEASANGVKTKLAAGVVKAFQLA